VRGPTVAADRLRLASAAVVVALCASRAEAQAQPPGKPGPIPQGLPPFGLPSTITIEFPGPPAPTPDQIRTAQLLDQAKQEDSGRRLEWVWADIDGGFEQLGLQTLNGGSQGFVAGFVNTSSSGGALGAAAGARLLFLTLLLRLRAGVFDSGALYRIGPEVGFHIPFGRVEPHFAFGLGYAGMGNLRDTQGGVAASLMSLRGFYTRVGAGLDYFVVPVFSLGVDASTELLGLFRPALDAVAVQKIQNSAGIDGVHKANAGLLASSGAGWGGTIALTGQVGLHF
jgi:hypothetical protein